jgi:ribonucleoside-diphosphate reductase alpha chain
MTMDIRERPGVTHKVRIGEFTGFITINEDPGEVFIHDFGKLGSAMQGWADAYAIMVSLYWQAHGNLLPIATRFAKKRFQPCGKTDNPEIPTCDSLPDYIFRWLALRWDDPDLKAILEMTA